MQHIWNREITAGSITECKSILKAAAFDFDIAVFGHGSALKGSASKKIREHFSTAS